MRDKKLQVFVSSTYEDLKEERQAAVEAILSSGNIPAGMELFAAGDESQMTVIKRWIDESDIYLLILGGRYGSIEPSSGKSYTQLEYEYALSINKPLFAVVISEKGLDSKVKRQKRKILEQKNQSKLDEFKGIVESNMVRYWDDTKDIKLAIHETLSDFSYNKTLIGWIRGDNAINSTLLAEQIAKLTKENSQLRSQLTQLTVDKEPLYFGLTYTKLKGLLQAETFEFQDMEYDLFDFMIDQGYLLFGSYLKETKENEAYLEQLQKYKLIQALPSMPVVAVTVGAVPNFDNAENYYTFTDEGHSFYLQAMATFLLE